MNCFFFCFVFGAEKKFDRFKMNQANESDSSLFLLLFFVICFDPQPILVSNTIKALWMLWGLCNIAWWSRATSLNWGWWSLFSKRVCSNNKEITLLTLLRVYGNSVIQLTCVLWILKVVELELRLVFDMLWEHGVQNPLLRSTWSLHSRKQLNFFFSVHLELC